jgi:hypothetical protein
MVQKLMQEISSIGVNLCVRPYKATESSLSDWKHLYEVPEKISGQSSQISLALHTHIP